MIISAWIMPDTSEEQSSVGNKEISEKNGRNKRNTVILFMIK